MSDARKCASGSVVERLLAKEKVAGSIPVSRSIKIADTRRVSAIFLSPILGSKGSFSPPARSVRKQASTGRRSPPSHAFFCPEIKLLCWFPDICVLWSLSPLESVHFGKRV